MKLQCLSLLSLALASSANGKSIRALDKVPKNQEPTAIAEVNDGVVEFIDAGDTVIIVRSGMKEEEDTETTMQAFRDPWLPLKTLPARKLPSHEPPFW